MTQAQGSQATMDNERDDNIVAIALILRNVDERIFSFRLQVGQQASRMRRRLKPNVGCSANDRRSERQWLVMIRVVTLDSKSSKSWTNQG